MRDVFDLPNVDIGLGKRYRLWDDADPRNPPMPPIAEVAYLPTGQSKAEFFDVEHPSSSYKLSTADFREIYDPAA